MFMLYAKFEISLPSRVLVQWPDDQSIQFQFKHDDFDAEVELLAEKLGQKGKHDDDLYWTKRVDKISIRVGRAENEAVPAITPEKNGSRDLAPRASYFNKRLPDYNSAVLCIYGKIIKYFKYVLKNPFLDEVRYPEEDFANPTWLDENGDELRGGAIHFFTQLVPGMDGERYFGIKRFSPDLRSNFMEVLQEDLTPLLHEEILADAQGAILEGNFRRGILEMAIACELVVKQSFFAKTTPAGSAFEYLEDKGRVRVGVLDFISKISEDAFGESFKTVYPEDFRNIDYLFRCRNKIAHRGEVFFKDDDSELHTPDKKVLNEWWSSIDTLLEWVSRQV